MSDAVSAIHADCVHFVSYTGGAKNRGLAKAGHLDILPVTYAQFAEALSPVDLLLLHLPPAGPDGSYSMGLAEEYIADLVGQAKVVVAEINDQMPETSGTRRIRPEEIDFLVHTSRPLLGLPPISETAVSAQIAERVAGLIDDGATLQLGIGQLPEAVLSALSSHRDLGVHSGTIGDGVARLAEAGVITNNRKSIDVGQTVAGAIMGGAQSWAWADKNPALRLAPTSYTHSARTLAALDRFTAINAAIEVDLTGQINAEVAGGHYVGAIGAAGAFLRAAARSPGGCPIVALPASVPKSGGSRIVARLSGPVSTARVDAGIIVTEHGHADLRGRTLRERRRLMIDLAPPECRAALDLAPV